MFKIEFNPVVMLGNLSRLYLEQFAEQGQLGECREGLCRIYKMLEGPDFENFASQLIDYSDSISGALNEAVLPIEGLQLLSRVRELLNIYPHKNLFKEQLKLQCDIEFDDYNLLSEGLMAIGLSLYDPILFNEDGSVHCEILESAVLAESIDYVFKEILMRESFSVQEIINGNWRGKSLDFEEEPIF